MKKKEDITLGKRIRLIRNNLDLDQKEFADRIQSTVSALSNWENGRNKPKTKTLQLIADEGNITLDELLHGDFQLYCFDIFEVAHNDFTDHFEETKALEINKPENKMRFFVKVFNYVKENMLSYEDSDRIYHLYWESLSNEIQNIEYSNKGAITYAYKELESLKSRLHNYFFTPIILKDNSDKKPGEQVSITQPIAKRDTADIELYENLKGIISKAQKEVDLLNDTEHE